MCVVTSAVGKWEEETFVCHFRRGRFITYSYFYLFIFLKSFWLDNYDAKIKYPQMNISH